mgnify:CR=1 FL=1
MCSSDLRKKEMDKINFDGYLAPITGQAFGTIFEVSARSVDRKSVV